MKMKRSIKRYLPVVSLSLSLLMAAGGCDGGDGPVGGGSPVSVGLFTKTVTGEAESGSSPRRILVFKDGECVSNHSFVPGSGSLSLDGGAYRVATLSVPEGLDLPADGVVEGLVPSHSLGFAEGAPVSYFLLAPLTDLRVSASSASSYTATLVPATGILSLRVSGLPEGRELSFALKEMYASVGLDGACDGDLLRDYPVAPDGETACFPTPAEATLSYSIDGGEPRTLPLGRALVAGNRLTAELAWNEDLKELRISDVTVNDWIPGDDQTGEAN